MSEFSRGIAVVGLGYIGLPTAAALATRGVRVHGVDVNESTVASVARGEVPFVEPDLGIAVSGAVARGLLTASTEVPECDAYIIAVPTPFNEDRTADLSFIEAACTAIAPTLTPGAVVVLESTSPPGATAFVSQTIAALRPDLGLPHDTSRPADVHVAHCPERVLPGRIMIELVMNDRVVGGITRECATKAAAIYRVFCQGDIAEVDASTAEMAKLAENAFRDVNLAFANELSLICDELSIDVWDVIRSANRHPRVNILNPGPGVGGHCIAVDPWFIVSSAPGLSRLIRTAREVNDAKPLHVVSRVVERANRYKQPVIACLGLAFKANVDDLRESPAVEVVTHLATQLPEARILIAEPHVDALPSALAGYENAELVSAEKAVDMADIVVMLVDHNLFHGIRKTSLQGRSVFDTRGFWS